MERYFTRRVLTLRLLDENIQSHWQLLFYRLILNVDSQVSRGEHVLAPTQDNPLC